MMKYSLLVLKNHLISKFSFIALFVYYCILSVNIRPIADDYCSGAGTSNGVWSYIQKISQSWSGDYSQIVLNAFLVGFPIANWKLFLIGFTSLLLSVFLLIAIFARIFLWLSIGDIRPTLKKNIFICSSFVLLFWNLYWSFPASVDISHYYSAFAMADESFSAVFAWPTVIVQYLVTPFIIILGVFVRFQNRLAATIFSIFLALFTGMAGFALSISVFVTLILLQSQTRYRISKRDFVITASTILIGTLFSFFSPGSRNRSKLVLSENSEFSFNFIFRWFVKSILEFGTSIFTIGNFLVLLATFVVCLVVRPFFLDSINYKKMRSFFVVTAIFLLVYYCVISFSELLTYEAFWHLITFKSIIFIFLVFMGVYLAHILLIYGGGVLSAYSRMSFSIVFLFSICLVLVYSSQPNMKVLNRGNIWADKPAPLLGISDIEISGGWVDVCWQELRKARDFPERY